MTELLAAIAGVLATALIGVLVYFYKNTVTYDLISLTGSFELDENFTSSSAFGAKHLTFERLLLKNRGLRDLKDVRIFLENTPELTDFKVDDTSFASQGGD